MVGQFREVLLFIHLLRQQLLWRLQPRLVQGGQLVLWVQGARLVQQDRARRALRAVHLVLTVHGDRHFRSPRCCPGVLGLLVVLEGNLFK